jgi:asparagine synthase (glutamine-hydrolysing)
MCGIVCAFDLKSPGSAIRQQVLDMSKKVRHRGPDWSGIYCGEKAVMAHERLSIVDPASGRQPLYNKDRTLILAVNGEIYNHQEIRKKYESSYEFLTQSDCEVILPLYLDKGPSFLDELNGIFAFALYDERTGDYMIARDHIGIVPLYMGHDKSGNFYVASELKALEGVCNTLEEFPPAHFKFGNEGKLTRWHEREWTSYEAVKDNPADVTELRQSLEAAVHRQLMSDVPYGVLLSGGLDSSVISAIAKKYAAMRIETDDSQPAWWPQLHSFAIGLEGSPDLAAANKAASHIGTIHHEIHYTLEEGLDAIRDVIYHLETYDVTSVRASTPMYLLARVIRSMGIKMVLSGEGADEIFGGYLYFHKAPNAKEFHEETVRKLSRLHLYDCLRANKSLAAWGVEGRVPFLDKEFLDVAMRLNPKEKMAGNGRIEKWIVRKTFEDYLPESIAWRQKEQFSDGVGYGWIDTLKKVAAEKVTDEMMSSAKYRFPVNTPMSKEEYHYRSIFSEHYPSDQAAACVPSVPSIACSTGEALAWDKSFRNNADPSGRAVLAVHTSGTDFSGNS